MFTVAEWREIVDHMWDFVISKNKEYKINTLKNMQAERQIAAAVVQALSGPSAQSRSELDSLLPGVSYSVCSTASQVRAAAEAPNNPPSSTSSTSLADPVLAGEEGAVGGG